MQHYHLYGCLGDVCYRLPMMERKNKVLWSEEFPSDTRASVMPGAKTFILNVNVNSSDFTKPMTNQNYCDEILAWAEETKLDHIVDLRDTFKIELDYMLYTGTNVMLYEGSSTWTVQAKEILVPSQVDEENNTLGYRKAVRFEKTVTGIEKSLTGSYGLMCCERREEFYFLIKGIRIKGVSDEGFGDRKKEYLTSVVDLTGRRRYVPSVASENSILLFDSEEYGIDFPPEKIQFRPKKLDVELNIVLNNFCEFGNEEALLAIVHENSGQASSETGDPRWPCHPNIHPHHGVYIPHPTRPICPARPPIPLVPPRPEKPDEPNEGEDTENPDVTPPTEGDGSETENPPITDDTNSSTDDTEGKDDETTGNGETEGGEGDGNDEKPEGPPITDEDNNETGDDGDDTDPEGEGTSGDDTDETPEGSE